MTAQGPLVVLVSTLLYELRHFGVIRRMGVLEVFGVSLRALQGVVLDADEVVDDIVGDDVPFSHFAPFATDCYPLAQRQNRIVVGVPENGLPLGLATGEV